MTYHCSIPVMTSDHLDSIALTDAVATPLNSSGICESIGQCCLNSVVTLHAQYPQPGLLYLRAERTDTRISQRLDVSSTSCTTQPVHFCLSFEILYCDTQVCSAVLL